ncbi:MAG: DUF2314 domain-containing protein [Cellvibrio sp.]|uniref:YegJ family protein n=1 Tax=Cellvibrio sp. TaxID=1965322 RepID=UPI0031ABE3C2
MINFRFLILVMLVLLASCSYGDKTVDIAADDPEMLAAFSKAKETLPTFWGIYEKPNNGESDFALKVKIEDENGVEYFWVINIDKKDGQIFGEINNNPEIVESVKDGEVIEVIPDHITDWQYIKNEKIVGNFTMRVLLKHMPEDEAKEYRDMLAEP